MGLISFKDLEKVRLKATYKLDLGNISFDPGETIIYFDKIQVATLAEQKQYISANGGYDNRGLVYWESEKEMRLNFSQGVFSKEQFALMSNSKIFTIEQNKLLITYREILESDENGIIESKYIPYSNIYVYDYETGNKLNFSIEDNKLNIDTSYLKVILDYAYIYEGSGQMVNIGQQAINGYVELEGITRVKDDTTGQVGTGLIKIPQLKLMSDLSMRLGSSASPINASFQAVAIPVGSRGNSYITKFYFLDEDIESDL